MTESERGLIMARIDYVVACTKVTAAYRASRASVDELDAADAELTAAIDQLTGTIERVAK